MVGPELSLILGDNGKVLKIYLFLHNGALAAAKLV